MPPKRKPQPTVTMDTAADGLYHGPAYCHACDLPLEGEPWDSVAPTMVGRDYPADARGLSAAGWVHVRTQCSGWPA